jgi:CheY-like chemotaxis protein
LHGGPEDFPGPASASGECAVRRFAESACRDARQRTCQASTADGANLAGVAIQGLIVLNHPRSRTDPAVPPFHATVLLVDREALYRWFVAESLRGCGVDVVGCGSMEEAENTLRGAAAPDLLVVDGEMLGGPDAEALRVLRAHAGVVPCLVLDSGLDVVRTRLGRVTVADKPVDAASVVALVVSQLRPGVPTA